MERNLLFESAILERELRESKKSKKIKKVSRNTVLPAPYPVEETDSDEMRKLGGRRHVKETMRQS